MDSGPVSQLLRCLSASSEPTTEWNEVVATAVYHGLAPLLFKRLKNNNTRAGVPADSWKRLRFAYFAAADRNMRLYRELRPVLRRLRSSDIPVIVLKGAYLAEVVYGDTALRPMYDVDLMVPRAELPRAQAILLDMGGVAAHSVDIEWCCRRNAHLPKVVIRDLAIEIHWTIVTPTGPVRIDAAGLWDRAHPTTIAGVEVLALSPEDLLLHLCLHTSYRDCFKGGLRPFSDIAETIHRFRGELDWARVVDAAREWDAARYVGLTLDLARSLLDAGVPDDVLQRLVPRGITRRVLETARESVLTWTGYEEIMPILGLLGAKSIGDKAKLFRERVFLSREEMAAKYPASSTAIHLRLYYVLRLRDVIRTFGDHNLRQCRVMMRNLVRGRKVSLLNWLRSGKP